MTPSPLLPYRPLWPETTVFIGAGATAVLGMPTTAKLGDFFKVLAEAETPEKRRKELEDNKLDLLGQSRVALCDLLDLLSAEKDRPPQLAELSAEQSKILERLYPAPAFDDGQRLAIVVSLRRYYSWDSLCRVIRSTPRQGDKGDFLRDLFNLLDMHIQTNSGLPVCGGLGTSTRNEAGEERHTEGHFLQHESLRSARDCLVLLTNLLFACAYQPMRGHPAKYASYVEAARALARMMRTEGLGLARRFSSKLNDRRFYLHSTAFISMNFDPLFLSLFLSANEEINREESAWVTARDLAAPLKVALDLGHLWCVRPATSDQGKGAGMWYPFNESVAQRLNDPEHNTGRRVRIAKFYYPHGNSNTRLCPNCGKSSLHIGSGWTFPDPQLFPPSVLESFGWGYQPRSLDEKRWREERGHYDALQCFHCAFRTGARDNAMVMQTSFKGAYAPAIAETHSEIRALLEGTRHIVLLGYSLPADDVIWRACLAARGHGQENRHYCSVVVGYMKDQTRWLEGGALDVYLESEAANHLDSGRATIRAAQEIFGKNQVRAYVGGIPLVFTAEGEVDESLRKLLYPDDWGPRFHRQWWEGRS